ncbi:MAG: hypothetical protein ACLUUJ_00390 [Acutalibacteraceae bacterium]
MERRIHMLEEMEKNLEGFQQSVKMVLRKLRGERFPALKGRCPSCCMYKKCMLLLWRQRWGPLCKMW